MTVTQHEAGACLFPGVPVFKSVRMIGPSGKCVFGLWGAWMPRETCAQAFSLAHLARMAQTCRGALSQPRSERGLEGRLPPSGSP